MFAACFFVLARSLADAATVLTKQVGNPSLAALVLRLHEQPSDSANGSTYQKYVESMLLPIALQTGSRWQTHWALWTIGRRDIATKALMLSLDVIAEELNLPGKVGREAGDAAYLYLYQQLRSYSLQTLRGALAISDQTEYDVRFFFLRVVALPAHVPGTVCPLQLQASATNGCGRSPAGRSTVNSQRCTNTGCHHIALNLVANWRFDVRADAQASRLVSEDECSVPTARHGRSSSALYRPLPRRRSTKIDMAVPSLDASRAQTPEPDAVEHGQSASEVQNQSSTNERMGSFRAVLREAKKHTNAPPEFDINSFSF